MESGLFEELELIRSLNFGGRAYAPRTISCVFTPDLSTRPHTESRKSAWMIFPTAAMPRASRWPYYQAQRRGGRGKARRRQG